MVLGEYEILGQVGDALDDAESTGVVSSPLLNLFRHAVRIGRRVRAETEISRNPVSVSSVAIDLARKKIGDLSGCKILVISAGEASNLAIKALSKHGISDFIVASRSYDKAYSLALEYGGRAVPLHGLREPLIEADIVVSCSGAPHFLVKSSLVKEAMHIRADRPLVLIDIAVPRDVDPASKEIENVYLYNIDDLQSVSASNQRRRANEKEKVISIIDEEVYRFKLWWHSLEAVPTISALTSKAESIRTAQLYKIMARIQVSTEEHAAIDAMTQAIVKKILHDPITHIRKNGNGNNYIKAVQELFNLDNIA
jgi:glutamyl-tRNA reductase